MGLMVMGVWNFLVTKSWHSFGFYAWEKVCQVADIYTTNRLIENLLLDLSKFDC